MSCEEPDGDVGKGTGAPSPWGQAGEFEPGGGKVVWRGPSTFPGCEEAPGKWESDSSSGTAVTGQGGMGSN